MFRFLLVFIFLLPFTFSNAQTCCPSFDIGYSSIKPCVQGAGGGTVGNPKRAVNVCKENTQQFSIIPNISTFTYTWAVTGGTVIGGTTGNPKYISWDTSAFGSITVYISSTTGPCKDTVVLNVEKLDRPTAKFNYTPTTTICPGTNITFNNTSLNGNAYNWNFGDGTGSNAINTTHSYANSGTYTVTLTVYNLSQGEICGCSDTAIRVINVSAGTVPVISSTCKKMLCQGDTVDYCVSPLCPPYTWSLNGGTIIGPTSSSCVKVLWNTTPAPFPASITVSAGTCSGQCSNVGTFFENVLYPNIPITGNVKPCPSSTQQYSITNLPGTFYSWNVSGPAFFTSPNFNTSQVQLSFPNVVNVPVILTVAYTNLITGCSGSSTLTINPRPVFDIELPNPTCVGFGGYYYQPLTANCNWTITPNSGFTPGGTFSGVDFITPTWLTAGTYTIAASPTAPNAFCNVYDEFSLVINDTPAINTPTGPLTVCATGNFVYAVTSNAFGPFTWLPTGGVVISNMGVNNDSVVVNWTGASPYSLIVFQTVKGCNSSFPVINIGTLGPPSTPIGSVNACVDQNFTYTTNNTFPNGAYTWSINPPNGGTIINGQGTNQITVQWHGSTLSPATVNTIYVTTCSGQDSVIVTVSTPPPVTIIDAGTFCTGRTLTASITGVAYQWYLNNVPIPSSNTQSITITQYGLYKVEVFQVIGGCASKTTFAALQDPNVWLIVPCGTGTFEYAGDTTISKYCKGGAFSAGFTIGNNGGTWNYQWYQNNYGTPVGTNSSTYSTSTFGTFWAVATNIVTGCNDTAGYCRIDSICCDLTRTKSLVDTGCSNNKYFNADVTPAPSPAFPYFWCYGDGGNATTPTDTSRYYYRQAGNYTCCFYTKAIQPGGDTCAIQFCKNIAVNIVADFDTNINCGSVNLFDISTSLPGYSSYVISWGTTGGGVFAPNNTVANPTVTYTSAGNYVITLTITANGCTSSKSINVFVPLAGASINGPNLLCAGTEATFSALPFSLDYTYSWNFGDNATSFIPVTQHSYPIPPPSNYTITVNVQDASGCAGSATLPINVIPPFPVFISIDGATDTFKWICPGDSAVLRANTGFQSYQWYKNGVPIPGAIYDTIKVGSFGAYTVVISLFSGGCVLKSNELNIFLYQLPNVNIIGRSLICIGNLGNADVLLQNVIDLPNYVYTWNLQGLPAILSTDDSLYFNTSTLGDFSYVLTVTDANTGCVVKDTQCIVVAQVPNFSTSSNNLIACSGDLNTFYITPVPLTANFDYLWFNNSIDSFININGGGVFTFSVTDPNNGCAVSGSVFTNSSPNASLFPIGCDTLCQTDSVIVPIKGFSLLPGGYTIDWFDNGNYASPIANGYTLQLAALSLGQHNLSVVITQGNGCYDTSNVFNLFVKDCTPIPLNINQVTLYGNLLQNTSHLNWRHYNTQNLLHYVVYKENGLGKFLKIGIVDAMANKTQYSFSDEHLASLNLIYKVGAVYSNGMELFSNTIKLVPQATSIAIYPNPNTGDILHVQFDGTQSRLLSVYDTYGKQCLSTNSNLSTYNLNISQLVNGVYTLKVIDDAGNIFNAQFVIAK